MRDMMPVCPVCGAETNDFLMNDYNEIVGCTDCVRTIDAWEYTREEEFSKQIDRGYDRYLDRIHGF